MSDAARGRIDDISYKLGRSAEGLENLNKMFEQHCDDDDRRHRENVGLIKANTEAIDNLSNAMRGINDSIAFMRPVVDGYVMTKSRLALLALIGTGIMIAIGWILEAALKWAIGLILKAKFGG